MLPDVDRGYGHHFLLSFVFNTSAHCSFSFMRVADPSCLRRCLKCSGWALSSRPLRYCLLWLPCPDVAVFPVAAGPCSNIYKMLAFENMAGIWMHMLFICSFFIHFISLIADFFSKFITGFIIHMIYKITCYCPNNFEILHLGDAVPLTYYIGSRNLANIECSLINLMQLKRRSTKTFTHVLDGA